MNDPYRIDGHKLIYHPERVAAWRGAGGEWAAARSIYPLYLEISPVGACNHRCRFCAVDYIGYQPRRLSLEVLERALPEMGAAGVKAVMYAGEGEPMLHRDMARIVEITHAAGIDTAFTTNGSVLRDDFLDRALALTAWIKVSINAGRAGTYARIHGTRPEDFERVLGNLERLVRARESQGAACTLGAQILLLPENAGEVELLARRCRDLGLDYLVVKPYSQHRFSHTRAYAGLDYRAYLELEQRLAPLSGEGFRLVFRAHTMRKHGQAPAYSRCHATPFFWAYVMADGEVYGCSAYLGDPRFALGNLHRRGFREIWEGEARRRNLALVRDGLDIGECRRNCRMDEVNRYLEALCGEGPPHVNFI